MDTTKRNRFSKGHCRCTVRQYSPAWALGTGLRVALNPGEYQVTGTGTVHGMPFLYLDDAYHSPADVCEENNEQQGKASATTSRRRAEL